jgi:hypothetical protein
VAETVPSIESSPCPACGAPPGCLRVEDVLVAQPLGTFSLAGNQMKVSARTCPKLTCTQCRLELIGRYEHPPKPPTEAGP